MLANGFGSRPTQDLDFFTRPGGGRVGEARDGFVRATAAAGWTVEIIRDSATFCRMIVHGAEHLLVGLALDSAPGRLPTITVAGPTYAPEELAGRKGVALFDRAAAGDLVDVFALSKIYSREQLLVLAGEVYAGFDRLVFATMLEASRDIVTSICNSATSMWRNCGTSSSPGLRSSAEAVDLGRYTLGTQQDHKSPAGTSGKQTVDSSKSGASSGILRQPTR